LKYTHKLEVSELGEMVIWEIEKKKFPLLLTFPEVYEKQSVCSSLCHFKAFIA